MHDSPLLQPTPPEWTALALERFDDLLVDHAHCEKKAAAHAMALIAQYPAEDALLLPLAALAREELGHFRQVVKVLQRRGLPLAPDGGDPYVKRLLGACRHGERSRLVDRLLVAGIVEARSAERLRLLAEGLEEPALKAFYASLALAEAGHHRLFWRFARKVSSAAEVRERAAALLGLEDELLRTLPLAPRMH